MKLDEFIPLALVIVFGFVMGIFVHHVVEKSIPSTLERDCSLVGTHVINETTAIRCIVLRKVDQPEVERKPEPKLGEGI